MSINLRDYQHFTITDLSGGENQFASTYKVGDNELVSTKNMSFKDSGGIKVRLGDYILDPDNTSGVSAGINNMYRYVRADGTKKTMMYSSDGSLWIDSDDNSFSEITDSITSNDGHCRFTQYYDTAFFGTERDPTYIYNSDESTTTLGQVTLGAKSWYMDPGYTSVSTSGGTLSFEQGPYIFYRYTFDYQYGDFIGESSPIYQDNFRYIHYLTTGALLTSGDTHTVQIKKYVSTALPSTIARINVYRSRQYQNEPKAFNRLKYEFFYVGSISRESWNAASQDDIVFEDGGRAPGKLIGYNKMILPPKGRFIDMHKNRLFMSYVKVKTGLTESWANDINSGDELFPHRVYISSINGDGVVYEPGVFYSDQFIEVEPRGSGITGTWSYQNSIFVVFKPNSMWALVGDDPHPQTGNMGIRNISNTVGCIAPESICEVEGRLVWLSNSGVYYWDGASKPQPLKTDNIVDSVQGISDSAKKDVASVYDRKQREMLMAYSDAETAGYNKKVAKYDVRTSAWSIDQYDIGYGAFLTKDEPTETSVLYGGFNDIAGNRTLFGSVDKMNFGHSALTQSASAIDIPFEFQTKFYDANAPFMDKQFVALSIDLKTSETLAVDVLCDNRLDTRNDDSGFTIGLPDQDALVWAATSGTGEVVGTRWFNDSVDDSPTQILNTNSWASTEQGNVIVYLDSRCWGKRISLITSGDVQDPVNIDSITVFYKPKEHVRES